MPNKTPFRLNRSGLLLAVVSAAFAGQQAQAAAGRVEFAFGPATVVGTDGRTRPASRGMELDTGDTVRTNNGRVHMRMTDGAYISLQPNTEFGIKNYKFEGKADGSENAFYSLLKGAMRTVTGLIGRVNRNRYQVATPTATVGIRGTGGVIEVLQDGGTLVQGTSGIWFLANPAGTIDIPAGVSGVAPADPNQPPQETTDVPTSGPAPLPPQEFSQGEQRESDGKNVLTSGVLVSGDGYVASLAYGAVSDGLLGELFRSDGSAVFNGAGQLTEFGSSDLRSSFLYRLEAGGSHVEFGTDGIVAWGRWIGPVTNPNSFPSGQETYNADQGLHYVIGMPTPVMPQSGPANYTLIGATSPTYIEGGVSPGTFSGSLSITDWATGSVQLNLNISMPDSRGYLINGIATLSGEKFSGSFSSGQGVIGTTQGSCSCFCFAGVDGFFAGTDASRAGLGYFVEDSFPVNKTVVGAAAFAKQ